MNVLIQCILLIYLLKQIECRYPNFRYSYSEQLPENILMEHYQIPRSYYRERPAHFKRSMKRENHPQIEIRASLTDCPKYSKDHKNATVQFPGFKTNGTCVKADIIDCKRKVLFTIKITSKVKGGSHNEFIIVDHVFDPITHKEMRLLNPYIIKLHGGAVYQKYKLHHSQIVNADAREQIRKKDDSETEFKTKSDHPQHDEFICSCDNLSGGSSGGSSKENTTQKNCNKLDTEEDKKEEKRSADSEKQLHCRYDKIQTQEKSNEKMLYPSVQNDYLSSNLLDFDDNSNNMKLSDLYDSDSYAMVKDELNDELQNYKYQNDIDDSFENDIPRMEPAFHQKYITRDVNQVILRGGQTCYQSNNVNNVTTVHSLNFSDLWYDVYRITSPSIDDEITIQIFEKHDFQNGVTEWIDLNNGTAIKLSTKHQHVTDNKLFGFTYVSKLCTNSDFNLNPKEMRLLIPRLKSSEKECQFPETQGGPGEYLIVSKDQLTVDGQDCDKIGVGNFAFTHQHDECLQKQGSCLQYQPSQLWRKDKEAEQAGQSGCHFLKFYGSLPPDPVRVNKTGYAEGLYLKYEGVHSAIIDVELLANHNLIIRDGVFSEILEIYTDNTHDNMVIVSIKIINAGLSSSEFGIQISCPINCPKEWKHLMSKLALIPPRKVHVFEIEMKGKLKKSKLRCKVEVVNKNHEIIAKRTMKITCFDRCVCMYEHACKCIKEMTMSQCVKKADQPKKSKGAQFSMPSFDFAYLTQNETMKNMPLWLFIIVTILEILLYLGLLKALFGLCIKMIAIWGLNYIAPVPALKYYKEPELQDRDVVRDDFGWPIHPDTGKHSVRVFSRAVEFMWNLIFFFLLLIFGIYRLLRMICCCQYVKNLDCCKKTASEYSQIDPNERNNQLEDIIEEVEEEKSDLCDKCVDEICPKSHCKKYPSHFQVSILHDVVREQATIEVKSSSSGKDIEKSDGSESENNSLHPVLSTIQDEEKKTTEYNVMAVSHSVKTPYKIKSNPSNVNKKNKIPISEEFKEIASEMIRDLLKKRIVYLELNVVKGKAVISPGSVYSVRGYFFKIENENYRFIPFTPLKQYWKIFDGQAEELDPPRTLDPTDFEMKYSSSTEVFRANQLSIIPRSLVINENFQCMEDCNDECADDLY